MKSLITSLILISSAVSSNAQDMVVFQSNMRSKAANKFYEEEFRTVGTYKVKGNSFLLKGNNVSDIFTTLGYGVNLGLVFDTHTQHVAVMQPDKTSVIDLAFDEIDSFYLKIDYSNKLKGPVMFRNMTLIDPSLQFYMQELVNGRNYKLYKSYYSELINASTNIAQTNLKEFEIRSDYYYIDCTQEGPLKPIKIKTNMKNLKEIFNNNESVLNILSNYTSGNREEKLIAVFETADAS